MEKLVNLFTITRERTEKICYPLKTEDYVPQPAVFASPPKWHLAHTTWFFEEMILKKFDSSYQEYHPRFGFLFNSYYNSVGERTDRGDRGIITRPSVEEVYQYRSYVTKKMSELLKKKDNSEIFKLTELGINHEQQHQELLITDLKYLLAQNPISPIYKENGSLVNSLNIDDGSIKIPEGIYEIGYKGDGFHFDNEKGRHKVFLHEFEISNSLVTNGEYIEFIEAGGYTNFKYWLDEGWSWVNTNKIQHPLYWKKENDKWHYFTLSGLEEINPDWIKAYVLEAIENQKAGKVIKPQKNTKPLIIPDELQKELDKNSVLKEAFESGDQDKVDVVRKRMQRNNVFEALKLDLMNQKDVSH